MEIIDTEHKTDVLKFIPDALLCEIAQHLLGSRINMDYLPFAFFEKHDPVACIIKNTLIEFFRFL